MKRKLSVLMLRSMLKKLMREVMKMKKIEAIIRPENLESVRVSLEENDIISMTVLEVQGRGRQKGVCLQWRAGEYCVEFLPKLRLDIVVPDDKLETAIEAITAVAKTGKNGDGKIFVYPVEEVIRLSTGERGEEAI